MTSERSEFEKWAVTILGDNPNWRESGNCELAWQSWKARATQPALPEMKDTSEYRGSSSLYAKGWNDCLNAVRGAEHE